MEKSLLNLVTGSFATDVCFFYSVLLNYTIFKYLLGLLNDRRTDSFPFLCVRFSFFLSEMELSVVDLANKKETR